MDDGFHWGDCAVLLPNVEFGQPPQPAPGGPAPPCKPLLYLRRDAPQNGPGVDFEELDLQAAWIDRPQILLYLQHC